MCKFCTAKFYYLQFDFRKKISINHQSKTSSGGISKDRNKVGASFKIGDLYLFLLKKQIALI